MNKVVPCVLATVFSALLLSCTDKAAAPGAPLITAQGFDISETQRGMIGQYGDLKLRIEAGNRIDRLYVKERSYEVDLAKSPERAHFDHFGLPHRTENQTDITLNFRNYINEKLTAAGPYEFLIEVADKKGGSATARLKIELLPASKEAALLLSPVERAIFELQRVGAGRATGTNPFGIEWTTTDAIHVTIEIRKTANRPGKLHALSRDDYAAIGTKWDISRLVGPLPARDAVHIDTANNAAVGYSFAVSDGDRLYALLVNSSTTSLSEAGTTVAITGEYKL